LVNNNQFSTVSILTGIFRPSHFLKGNQMKKIILASILATMAGLASAQTSVSVGRSVVDSDVNGQQTHRTSLTVRTGVGYGLVGDVGVINSQNDTTRSASVRQELGLSGTVFTAGAFSANVRGGIGLKTVSGSEATSYYSIEPGVNYKITDALTARVAYRYRDAFSSGVADRSDTTRVGVSYAVTKKDTIGLGYDVAKKDGAETATTLSYTRSF
jgi:long-subunit fatty acid transport protein